MWLTYCFISKVLQIRIKDQTENTKTECRVTHFSKSKADKSLRSVRIKWSSTFGRFDRKSSRQLQDEYVSWNSFRTGGRVPMFCGKTKTGAKQSLERFFVRRKSRRRGKTWLERVAHVDSQDPLAQSFRASPESIKSFGSLMRFFALGERTGWL